MHFFLEIRSKVKNHHISEAGVSFENIVWSVYHIGWRTYFYTWQQTTALTTGISVIGRVICSMANHLILLIAHSTCILAFAIFLVFLTFSVVICPIPDPGGGISNLAWRRSKSSLIRKPRSAWIVSLGSTLSRKPDSFTIWLPEARPPVSFFWKWTVNRMDWWSKIWTSRPPPIVLHVFCSLTT